MKAWMILPLAAAIPLLVACQPGQSPAEPDAGLPPPVLAEDVVIPAPDHFPDAVAALGNEPFWSVRVDGTHLIWTTPDKPQGTPMAVRRTELANGVEYRGERDGQRLRLELTQGQCSDGMSDRVYPWLARWEVDGTVLQGCGMPGQP